jgi:hypothetical protein
MLDITYTIGRDTIRFAALSPKGWGKCSEMARYQRSTGPFLVKDLPSIVAQLESEGYAVSAAEAPPAAIVGQ